MYRLRAGLANLGSCAKVALPFTTGCLMAPRRYTTPLRIAHPGLPVLSSFLLADCQPLISSNECQVRFTDLASVACALPPCATPPSTGEAIAAGRPVRGSSAGGGQEWPPRPNW